jgi:small subunit ribosomal protein S2
MNISISDLFEAGVHLGHQKRRWNPKSKHFIYDHRGGISIIDLEKTYRCLGDACAFLEELAAKGRQILFVATKKQAQEFVREAAISVEMPFCVSRWLGGCLTNFETVRRSLNKYRRFLAMETDGTLAAMLKKEAAVIRRQMARMQRGFEGMLAVNDLPDALFIVDVYHEDIAAAEAKRLNIPVVAMVDTNSDPGQVTYPIPANDDSTKSIRIILDAVTDAIKAGQVAYEARQSGQRQRQKIVTKGELIGGDGVTMDAALESGAEKVTEKDEAAAIASHEKPAVPQKRRPGMRKLEGKSDEKVSESGV